MALLQNLKIHIIYEIKKYFNHGAQFCSAEIDAL